MNRARKRVHPTSSLGQIRKFSGRAIRQYRMISEGDRVLVGISGGVDSLILAHVLHYHQRRAPIAFELRTVTVDMGFEEFDAAALEDYCNDQGWTHTTVHGPGQRLIADKNLQNSPCSLCARLRRGIIYARAQAWGCTKLALGQHLDDACTSLLMALFRGHGIMTMGPNAPADHGRLRVIRPFCAITRDLLKQAAREFFSFPALTSCPYLAQLDETGDRAFLERLLDDLGEHFPNLRQNMKAAMANLETEHLYDLRFIANPPTEPRPVGSGPSPPTEPRPVGSGPSDLTRDTNARSPWNA